MTPMNVDGLAFFPSDSGRFRAPFPAVSSTDLVLACGPHTTSMQLLSPNGQVLSDTAVPSGSVVFPIVRCAPTNMGNVTFGVQ